MIPATIIDQNATTTTVKCPHCKRPIVLHHEAQPVPKANDDFGALHRGEQLYSWVVCMNKTKAGIGYHKSKFRKSESDEPYCDFANDMRLTESFKGKYD